jgi:23S rRNA (guanosine2251-2'-O)-methyltransferase
MIKRQDNEIVYGIHPIRELLKAKQRKIVSIYTTRKPPREWSSIHKLLPKYINIQYVDKATLDKLAGTTDHQSVVAWAAPFIMRKKFFDPSKQPFIVMLDGIQDPRNVGAIMRSAYCTGADGIILTTKKSSPLNATVYKSSAGLAEHLDVYSAPSAQAAILELKNAGYTIYISTLEKAKNAHEVEYKLPCCIVIGSEGTGVTKSIIKDGITIKLPQRTPDISYNASVAAGILLFLVGTQKNII